MMVTASIQPGCGAAPRTCAASVGLLGKERQDGWNPQPARPVHAPLNAGEAPWVASQMGARAGRDQLMGSQAEGREWGTGDKGRRGEQSCARSPFVSRVLLATVPLFRERLAKGAVPRCRDGCRKWPSRLAVWQQGHFVELPGSFSSLRLILTLASSQRLSLLKIPLLPAYLQFPQQAL